MVIDPLPLKGIWETWLAGNQKSRKSAGGEAGDRDAIFGEQSGSWQAARS